MISILIADDDINKISSIIRSIQDNYKSKVEIKQVSTVQETIEILQNNHFHLLISDLVMPIRVGELPNEKGGENLIKEIYKTKNNVNVPIYIIGLTQFVEVKHNFSGVWKVWNYDSSSKDWQNKLRDLIYHISKINFKIIKEKQETIFVEGSTDKLILELAFKLFFEEFLNKVSIETVKYGGGSSWVERQLVIWGKTLLWKDKEKANYLKAIGLFDNDEAGIKSMESLGNQIQGNSAEKSTFSTIKLNTKYTKHLIPIYTKGLVLPITLEEMYAPCFWQYAKEQNWLVERVLSDSILKDSTKWDKNNFSLKQHLSCLNLLDEEDLFVRFKINEEHKMDFVKYIRGLNDEEQKEGLAAFQLLIRDMLVKLKLLKDS